MIENQIYEAENRRAFFDIAGDSPTRQEDDSYGQQEFEQYVDGDPSEEYSQDEGPPDLRGSFKSKTA